MDEKVFSKKKIVILVIILIAIITSLIFGVYLYKEKKDKEELEKRIRLNRKINVEVYKTIKISEVFAAEPITITYEDNIDTNKLGERTVKIKYTYGNKKYKAKVKVNVVDTTAPTIFSKSTYKVYKGSNTNFVNYILCGDNYDDTPTRKIIGNYDLNKVGTYRVSYYAVDSSGNEASKNFVIKVVEKPKSTGAGGSSSSTQKLTSFKSVYDEYKKDNNHIGIDVSKYQGEIDFDKVKNSDCEFVIIRLGYQKGINGELVLDPYFKTNIENATKAGLKIGVYIYTYAKSKDDALKQAKWIVDNVGGYKRDLGVSYDWESWTYFNVLNLSYHSFSEVADTFLKEVEKAGYDGVLYSSKYYLENIWNVTTHKVWLAHYTKATNYRGKYNIWQMMSTGSIDGIKGAVDIDILYD